MNVIILEVYTFITCCLGMGLLRSLATIFYVGENIPTMTVVKSHPYKKNKMYHVSLSFA